jgi:Fe-S oxidoreductase
LIQRNVGLLDQYASQGVPILGLEPSCLLTLVDEYPDLFPSEATARVARQARLIEAFLAEHWPESLPRGTATTGTSGSTPGAPQVLLHGHCQQKALVGTGATRRALTEVAGLEVREVDSGCCGMAGSFGYEHYDVSQQIGERVLFPAVRAHAAQGADHVICAPGFSCRHQIAEGTERRAWHPIELLHQQRLGGPTH